MKSHNTCSCSLNLKSTVLASVLLVAFLVLCTVGVVPGTAQTAPPRERVQLNQDGQSIVEKGKDFDPPVDITFLQSRIGGIELDKKFPADKDWFKGLKITVHNRSEKPITHISLKLHFPRPKGQENELDFVETLNYGESPIPDKDGQIPFNTVRAIVPGESVQLRLSDEMYDSLRMILEDSKYPSSIKKMKVYVSILGFSDGSLWMAGRTYEIDKNNSDGTLRRTSID